MHLVTFSCNAAAAVILMRRLASGWHLLVFATVVLQRLHCLYMAPKLKLPASVPALILC